MVHQPQLIHIYIKEMLNSHKQMKSTIIMGIQHFLKTHHHQHN
jgi:hypothetical protein